MSRVHARARAVVGAAATLALATVMFAATPASAVAKLTDARAAAQLTAVGISRVSSGNCTSRTNSRCTSYSQINQSTVDGIKTFKRISRCAVTITGGTEAGHSAGTYSHWNGYKVDIRRTTCADNYIRGHFDYIGVRRDGARMYRSGAGNIYANEGSHWDILYYTCGC